MLLYVLIDLYILCKNVDLALKFIFNCKYFLYSEYLLFFFYIITYYFLLIIISLTCFQWTVLHNVCKGNILVPQSQLQFAFTPYCPQMNHFKATINMKVSSLWLERNGMYSSAFTNSLFQSLDTNITKTVQHLDISFSRSQCLCYCTCRCLNNNFDAVPRP